MSKASKNVNPGEMTELAQAQQKYHDLVSTDTSKMSEQQKLAHQEKCRAALTEKKQAAAKQQKG